MKKLLAILAVVLFGCSARAQINYTYTLPVDSTNVTVGVKDSTGALIRTISTGYKNAGTYSGVWDGLTDSGTAPGASQPSPYSITVLYGSPTYSFNGVIGDTSDNLVGWDRWSLFTGVPVQMRFAFVGKTVWFASGYPEGTHGIGYFAESDPNKPHAVNFGYQQNGNIVWSDIATDGQFLYLTNSSAGQNANWAFVSKFDALTGQPAFFTDPSVSTCTSATFTTSCKGMVVVGNLVGSSLSDVTAIPGVTVVDIDVSKGTATTVAPTPPTAIAVQASGNILAVGHGNFHSGLNTAWNPPNITTNNDIKFFDKTTGLALGTDATLANPTSMAFTSAGLWVAGDGVLSLVANPSGANTVTHPITGLSYPMAVDASQTTGHIYVLDGGTAQQLIEFDASYNVVRTYGVPGGYTDCNPTVASNRLMLDGRAIYGVNGASPTFGNTKNLLPWVRVDTTGDVWLGDQFNYWSGYPQDGGLARIQHLTPSGSTFNYVNQIMKQGYDYNGAVGHNATSRLFFNWLEFQVNWDTPALGGDPQAPGGNGSWKLVRDWEVGAGSINSTPVCGNSNLPWALQGARIPSIIWADQMSNGHTYGLIFYPGTSPPPAGSLSLVEFPQSGTAPLRYIGPAPVGGATNLLSVARNGDIHWYTNSGTGAGATQNLWVKPFTGFDSNNNPQWGATSLLQAVTYNQATQPTMANNTLQVGIPSTEPNLNGAYPGTQWCTYSDVPVGSLHVHCAALASSVNNNYPHTAGILPGRNTYLYTVNPEVCSTYTLMNGSFPCGAGTGNFGPGTYVEGHQFVVAYSSQQSNYAPQFWHYWEDGMFVGQFGGWHTNTYSHTGPNMQPSAGPGNWNRFTFVGPTLNWRGTSWQLLGYTENSGAGGLISTSSGNLYLWLANEAYHAPMADWKIGNTSSIHEIAGTGNLGQSVIVNTPVF